MNLIRPLAVTEHFGRAAIVLEDSGGEPVDQFLSGPLELTSFLRIAVGLATALKGLHKAGQQAASDSRKGQPPLIDESTLPAKIPVWRHAFPADQLS